jgi:hypothetical protein
MRIQVWKAVAHTLTLAAMLVCGGVRPLSGQATMTTQQNLSFGMLTPGVPMVVAPTDVLKRAEVAIVGSGKFSLQFILPSAMVDAAGRQIPLTFRNTDGRVQIKNNTTVVDPRSAFNINIPKGQGAADIYLGGTATPAPGQVAGTYQATIVLMIVNSGA